MADTFVERLVVGVGYKTDHGSIQTVMGEFRGAFSSLTGYSAAIVAAASAGVMFALAQASAMDATADLAAQLRTTTEDLTGLEYAAGQSGMSTDELTSSLFILDRALKEASDSGTPAAKAMKDLGLSVYTADGRLRDGVGSIGDIADALSRVSDEGRRGQILTDLFGRSGAKLGPLLARGSEGIKELTDEAERLGLVLSTESAAAAGELVDSMEGLKGAARGLGWQVANVLIPPLTHTTEELTDWLTAQDGIVRGGMDRFVRGLSWVLAQMETPAGKATAGVIGLAGAVGLFQAGRDLPVISGLLKTLGPVAGRAGVAGLAIVALGLIIEEMAVTADGGDSAIRRLADAMGIGDETARTFAEGQGLLEEASKALGIIVPELASSLGTGLVEGFKDAGAEAMELAKALGFPEEVLQSMADAIATITDGLSGLQFLPELFSESASGFEKFSRFATGDESVQLASPIDPLNPGFTGDLIRMTAADRLAADRDVGPLSTPAGPTWSMQPGGGFTVTPSVVVQSGVSAREVAAEAGRATERETLRQMDAVGFLE